MIALYHGKLSRSTNFPNPLKRRQLLNPKFMYHIIHTFLFVFLSSSTSSFEECSKCSDMRHLLPRLHLAAQCLRSLVLLDRRLRALAW